MQLLLPCDVANKQQATLVHKKHTVTAILSVTQRAGGSNYHYLSQGRQVL